MPNGETMQDTSMDMSMFSLQIPSWICNIDTRFAASTVPHHVHLLLYTIIRFIFI
jgi:hypothetical protein